MFFEEKNPNVKSLKMETDWKCQGDTNISNSDYNEKNEWIFYHLQEFWIKQTNSTLRYIQWILYTELNSPGSQ